jgi:hypothetical protein
MQTMQILKMATHFLFISLSVAVPCFAGLSVAVAAEGSSDHHEEPSNKCKVAGSKLDEVNEFFKFA